ncbi:CDIF630_02480 family spore surface protein [Tissierella praeacuta]|uniref:CDIF630_02480 family spore surface protein n=1 Tax=Tissierella praeacuta TaxID=43131 RepID=UPI00104DE33A|nr:DUF3787 domain-containing protein [Tissierella praeacuta]MBU5256246.1 DUF3787 domain-containing protein [Tissierella praeacuta]TCU74175.1 uncharacterized protein DUF3787 [Tissierella praeacuta]
MKENKRSLNTKTDSKSATGSYKNHKDPDFGYSPTDIYYNTEEKISDSGVSIPTYDAVIKAKEWVDDINKK